MSASSKTSSTSNTKIQHRVPPLGVSIVLCHREVNGQVQFLVRWRSKREPAVSSGAFCSWHTTQELSACLSHVQRYIEARDQARQSRTPLNASASHSVASTSLTAQLNRKRKAPGAEPWSRDSSSGLLTPQTSEPGRASPVGTSSSVASVKNDETNGVNVYNGLLERKEGWFRPVKSNHPRVVTINATKLPTASMLEHALTVPIPEEVHCQIRETFLQKAKAVYGVHLENRIDNTTPSLDFTFIDKCVLREGVFRADAETNEGCQAPCRPNMGQSIGCEYTRLCSCLEYAAVDEQTLAAKDPAQLADYIQAREVGEFYDTKGLPKRFPYIKPKDPRVPSTLMKFYRDSRHPIYECNRNCNCGPICKSRLVQKGRRVELTVFKTLNRGWGVYCNEDLITGEFIDVYLGEIITNQEADGRELSSGKDKASYLYSLDKFVGDLDDLTPETCYVVDGQYMGGPTRFINHSCEPNVRQFTVSYNKHDLRIYDLAFFALEDIRAGTELTFDYVDPDEEEVDQIALKRAEVEKDLEKDPEKCGMKRCNCGATRCRGFLWV